MKVEYVDCANVVLKQNFCGLGNVIVTFLHAWLSPSAAPPPICLLHDCDQAHVFYV